MMLASLVVMGVGCRVSGVGIELELELEGSGFGFGGLDSSFISEGVRRPSDLPLSSFGTAGASLARDGGAARRARDGNRKAAPRVLKENETPGSG